MFIILFVGCFFVGRDLRSGVGLSVGGLFRVISWAVFKYLFYIVFFRSMIFLRVFGSLNEVFSLV